MTLPNEQLHQQLHGRGERTGRYSRHAAGLYVVEVWLDADSRWDAAERLRVGAPFLSVQEESVAEAVWLKFWYPPAESFDAHMARLSAGEPVDLADAAIGYLHQLVRERKAPVNA